MTVTIQVERLVSGPPSDPLILLNPEPAEVPPSPESPSALEPKSSIELPKLSLPKIQLPEYTIPSLSLSEIARVPERTNNGKPPSEKSPEALERQRQEIAKKREEIAERQRRDDARRKTEAKAEAALKAKKDREEAKLRQREDELKRNKEQEKTRASEAKARAAAAAKAQKEQEDGREQQRAQDSKRKEVEANFFGRGDKEVATANNDIASGPPTGVPVLSMWRKNSDGSISGLISGSPAYADGDAISTSPLKGEAISGSVVTTQSGSRYVMHILLALFPRL